MSFKLNSLIVKEEKFPFKTDGTLYCAEKDFGFSAYCTIDGVDGILTFWIKKGCLYNGASNPINWPIKNFYDDARKDACGLGHDILYAWGGIIEGLDRNLEAGEADDYIRGAMREVGFGRIPAGIVDRAVRTFAHRGHYGIENDKEGMRFLTKITWKKL